MAGSAIERVFSMKCTKLFMPYFFCRDRLIHVFNAGRNYSFLSTLGRFLSHGSCQVWVLGLARFLSDGPWQVSQSWALPGFSVIVIARFLNHGSCQVSQS